MKKRLVALAAIVLAAACSTASNDPQQKSASTGSSRAHYLPEENLYPVGSIPGAVIHDAKRNKDLAVTIEYPTFGGPYPVIIFSHGYGATKDSYTPLTEYWTGHGFICIKPSHADAGALRKLLEARRAERRAEMENHREETRQNRGRAPEATIRPNEPVAETMWSSLTPDDWSNRARDISLVIDSLDALERKYPELAGKMEKSQIGVAGHSLGAFTAMLIAGSVDFKTNPPIRLADSRVKAAIAMSPQGVSPELGLTAESWREVRIPMMFMTGGLDRGLGEGGDPKWRHDPFAYSPAGDKFFVSFAGARHGTFTGGVGDVEDIESPMGNRGMYPGGTAGNPSAMQQRSRGSRDQSGFGRDRSTFSQIKVVSTAFWDAYLKKDQAGLDYMKTGGTLDALNGETVTVERK